MSEKVDHKVLKWLAFVQHMNKERVTKRVYENDVKGKRGSGKPYLGRLEVIKRACNVSSLELRKLKLKGLDREQ